MEILRTSRTLTAKEQYAMTLGQGIEKMKDQVGKGALEVECWIHYKDVNSDGVIQDLLAVKFTDGIIAGTNSATFREDFIQMVDFFEGFGEPTPAIEVISGKSKALRDFITCKAV